MLELLFLLQKPCRDFMFFAVRCTWDPEQNEKCCFLRGWILDIEELVAHGVWGANYTRPRTSLHDYQRLLVIGAERQLWSSSCVPANCWTEETETRVRVTMASEVHKTTLRRVSEKDSSGGQQLIPCWLRYTQAKKRTEVVGEPEDGWEVRGWSVHTGSEEPLSIRGWKTGSPAKGSSIQKSPASSGRKTSPEFYMALAVLKKT